MVKRLLMSFSTIFINISWQSVLLVEKTTDLLQKTEKPYHIKSY